MKYVHLLIMPVALLIGGCDLIDDLIGPRTPRGNTNTYSSTVLADAPIAYWRFEELAGWIVADASGRGHHAQKVGTPIPAQTLAGKMGRAFRYVDGVDGVVQNDTMWSRLSAVTVEAWVRADKVQTSEGMIVVDKGSTWNLLIDPLGRPGFQFPGAVPPTTYANTPIVAGQTYYLAGTFGNNIMRLYVNGVLAMERTLQAGIDNRPTPVSVARGLSEGRFDFYGTVDEVAIYDKVLSADAIMRHYNAGR